MPSGMVSNLFGRKSADEFAKIFDARFTLPPRLVEAIIPGPDGRLYFICPDDAAVVPRSGEEALQVPAEGAVLRCEPDGSHLEVFCRGLHKSHGLAFDNLGNLFTADAGSGEDEGGRLLNLVQGADYGWRIGWSHSALSAARVPWMAEKPWAPPFDGQPAWALPAGANVPKGSWGVAHYPGTGFNLPAEEHFFVGNPIRRTISIWTLRPTGAGFIFLDQREACGAVSVRELAFQSGPGLEFVTHEIDTGQGREKERAHTLSPAMAVPDPRAGEVWQLFGDELLGGGMSQKAPIEWRELLKHPDQRVRLAAEWRLAASASPEAEYFLRKVALSPNGGAEPTIARLHGIWGLSIMARRAEEKAPGSGIKIVEPLVPLLEDGDAEVRAQAAAVLGDLRVSDAFDGLIKALRDSDPRVSMFAAQALAKLGNHDALPQILLMLREAGDHDPYVRHAYVEALLGLHDFPTIEKAARDESAAVRMGALLATREMRRAEMAVFLHDEEPALVREAARAIHDENIASALPQLAALIEHPSRDDSLMCRVLNANFRVGEPSNAAALANFAAREEAAEVLRVDALNLLGKWAAPPTTDYVTGETITLAARNPAPARDALDTVWSKLNSAKSAKIRAAAAQAYGALHPSH